MLRVFKPGDYTVMPWKNGGGTTTELYAAPGEDGFLWRVSIADVAGDGPFSIFAGYDRHIMGLSGAGMILQGGPNGDIRVAPPLLPCRFSGDWTISARPIDGPVRDFNFMVRRSHYRSELSCRRLDVPITISDGGTHFIHTIAGKMIAASIGGSADIGAGESLLASGPLSLSGAHDTTIAVCSLWPLA